jgi:hypothetical protein
MEEPRNRRYSQDRWELDRIRYHMDKHPSPNREIRKVGDLLAHVLEGLEVPKNDNVTVLQEVWIKLCGPQIAQHSKPVRIHGHALIVSVDLPGFLPELKRIERYLLSKIQAKYSSLSIRQLRFELTHR